MLRPAVLALTVLSGFTGLAYEVTWQKYLAILLGAHSEATSAVLGLFLGGLSLGYWLFGALTRRLVQRAQQQQRSAPLLRVYGAIEAGIGLWCLAFPWIFPLVRSASVALPTGEGAFGFAIDVVFSAMLIVPPATLMGGTIPILTQVLARDLADATRVHAQIYACNTAGAFAGTLATGFALIHWLGLDGTLHAMGLANLAIGAAFALLGRTPQRALADLDAGAPRTLAAGVFAVYGTVALLVGFAMMVLQTTVIRIGGLSFGSSEYTFTMVVAVFVLCIALGSFAVSAFSRIGRFALPAVLWGLATLFTALYFGLETAPYWGHVLRVMFRDIDFAFDAFYFDVFLGILVAIGPAVVFSGAVLPLLFHALRRDVGQLGSQAGRLYSVNTVGSLLGALIGGYALLFWLDLHHVYRIALCALAIAAAIATWSQLPKLRPAGAAALALASLAVIAAMPAWRPLYLSAGLFRERQPLPWSFDGPSALVAYGRETPIVFYHDDPNSTVAIVERGAGALRSRTLMVNGKSDGNSLVDYGTTALAGVLPALFAERVEHAFVIGFGTGTTAGELGLLDEVKSVTVAEISAGVIDAAPLFDFANHAVTRNPKVHIVHGDAYRALVRSGRSYDVIASEPSNPWVTGVEMLYSREFLSEARDRLTPRGVFCQWFHLYETSDEVIELVLDTYASVFDHVALWTVNDADALLLGFRDDHFALDLDRLRARLAQRDFRAAAARLEIADLSTLLAHETLPLGVVHAAALSGPVHSLYHPRLSFVAGRAFFTGGRGALPFTGFGKAAEIGRANSLLRRLLARAPDPRAADAIYAEAAWRACRAQLPNCAALTAAWSSTKPRSPRYAELAELLRSSQGPSFLPRLEALESGDTTAGLARVEPDDARAWTRLYRDYYAHAAPFDPARLVEVWQRCGAARSGEDGCGPGLREAEQLALGERPPKTWAAAVPR
jgi:spermidine synthase